MSSQTGNSSKFQSRRRRDARLAMPTARPVTKRRATKFDPDIERMARAASVQSASASREEQLSRRRREETETKQRETEEKRLAARRAALRAAQRAEDSPMATYTPARAQWGMVDDFDYERCERHYAHAALVLEAQRAQAEAEMLARGTWDWPPASASAASAVAPFTTIDTTAIIHAAISSAAANERISDTPGSPTEHKAAWELAASANSSSLPSAATDAEASPFPLTQSWLSWLFLWPSEEYGLSLQEPTASSECHKQPPQGEQGTELLTA